MAGTRGKAKSKGKSRAKKVTVAKGRKKSPSKSTLAKATNTCCPVIKTRCTVKKVLLPKKEWKGRWTGGSEGSGDYELVRTMGEKVTCSIQAGKRTMKNLDTSEMLKKRNELVDAQKAHRCVPLVEEAQ